MRLLSVERVSEFQFESLFVYFIRNQFEARLRFSQAPLNVTSFCLFLRNLPTGQSQLRLDVIFAIFKRVYLRKGSQLVS